MGKVCWNKITRKFYSSLNLEDITDADYTHEKRVCKDFEIKHLGEFRDLYLKSDISPLADVSKTFWKIYLKIIHLDAAKLFSAPGLV